MDGFLWDGSLVCESGFFVVFTYWWRVQRKTLSQKTDKQCLILGAYDDNFAYLYFSIHSFDYLLQLKYLKSDLNVLRI